MADEEIPFQVDCVLVPRRHGSGGWIIDVKIDGDTITDVYTAAAEPDREKVIQDALHAVKGVIRAHRHY